MIVMKNLNCEVLELDIEEAIETLKNAFKCNKKQFEELGTHILLQDDEQDAIETLLTAYEKEKEGREKLQYEATEAEEYIKELKKYIEKNKIRIPMPEEYQSPEDWGKEVTIQTKDYISKDEYEKLLNGYNKRVKEILKLEKQNEELDKKFKNAVPDEIINELYISKDKIKAKIEEIDEVLKGQLIEKIRVYFEAQKEVLQSLLRKEE